MRVGIRHSGKALAVLAVLALRCVAARASAGASSTTGETMRIWSPFCLCAITEFKARCLEDAARVCASPTAEISLHPETCNEVARGEVGYFLLHETDLVCKPPYTYDVNATDKLIHALGFAHINEQALRESDADGKTLYLLTVDQAMRMGLSLGSAHHLVQDVKELFEPHTPVDPTSMSYHHASTVEVAALLHEAHGVNEIDFSFEAKLTLYFIWTDSAMWAECNAIDSAVDEGMCGSLWRPRPVFANARNYHILSQHLESFPKLHKAMLELKVSGVFSAHMSFRRSSAHSW